MAMNAVQFQPGLSMMAFMERYGRDDKCDAALIESRWPDGFVCPACSCTQSSTFRREGRLYYQCSSCRHQCSVTSGTIFEDTKLPLTRWFLAMHILTQSKNNVCALEFKRHLDVCYKTPWLIKHKLMEAMRARAEGRQLDGRVGIDDAYLGEGKTGGKVGRGSENKVTFIATVQTTPDGNPQFMCLRQQPFTLEDVVIFAASSIAPTATVVSDGLWCFDAVQIVGATHQRAARAGARLAPTCRSFARSTRCWETARPLSVAPTMPSTSLSMPLDTSPRPNTDSIVVSI